MLHTVLRRKVLGESVEQIQPDVITPTGKRKEQNPSAASICRALAEHGKTQAYPEAAERAHADFAALQPRPQPRVLTRRYMLTPRPGRGSLVLHHRRGHILRPDPLGRCDSPSSLHPRRRHLRRLPHPVPCGSLCGQPVRLWSVLHRRRRPRPRRSGSIGNSGGSARSRRRRRGDLRRHSCGSPLPLARCRAVASRCLSGPGVVGGGRYRQSVRRLAWHCARRRPEADPVAVLLEGVWPWTNGECGPQ